MRTNPRTSRIAEAEAGRRVLTLEADALRSLAALLAEEEGAAAFAGAVDLMGAATGRVIVSGMGKSGHVARKIAATLASTGTPAQFVHPAEASHGDLGMIARSDAVLALSNSGETPELGDLVAYARRFDIPLIAIVGKAPSALAQAADAALVLPRVAEACPLGLAPTTSTTLMMALGDALAVALLERRGFSADDYRQLHPGGRLGARLLKVEDLMHKGPEMPLIGADAVMADAVLVMTEKRFGCVGVVEPPSAQGRLIGLVTDGDLRRHMSADLLERKVHQVMTRGPWTIGPKLLAAEVLKEMNDRKLYRAFAVEDGRPVGIVHVLDLLRAGVA
ncbi:MAG: KpsF/GutQ family sugar-phosphate isomerase [Alphaproteobacteria bacterium]|nr:KpsF/GutQ family sugar-phosphate isomerase [Alphaproteobacteria bacterium]